MKVSPELLYKYDRPGPRYTSYPTAPVWTTEFGAADQLERLVVAGAAADEPLALYVHLPFCESMCWYCGCNVVITKNRTKIAGYVDRVLREAALARDAMGSSRPVVQHHWGGGTPTALSPEEITKLFAGLCELFPLAEAAEVSIEVDPRVTTQAHIEALAAAGFNRISMGVQDFESEVQEAIHRVQSYQETADLVTSARRHSFESVSLDLVYGLPHQRTDSFKATLDKVLELSPDRLACYGYAHVPWLKKHQAVIPDEALPRGIDKLALYLVAMETLVSAGYEAIGMDHFAKPEDELARGMKNGTLHRNFMGYTTRPAEDMISFGVTAISEVAGAFAQNDKDLLSWSDAIDEGRLPVERGLLRSSEDELRRRVILDLMCRFKVRFDDHGGCQEFGQRYAVELEKLQPHVRDGLLEIDAAELRVTSLGRLFVRNLAMEFDPYLRRSASEGPMFSRTV